MSRPFSPLNDSQADDPRFSRPFKATPRSLFGPGSQLSHLGQSEPTPGGATRVHTQPCHAQQQRNPRTSARRRGDPGRPGAGAQQPTPAPTARVSDVAGHGSTTSPRSPTCDLGRELVNKQANCVSRIEIENPAPPIMLIVEAARGPREVLSNFPQRRMNAPSSPLPMSSRRPASWCPGGSAGPARAGGTVRPRGGYRAAP